MRRVVITGMAVLCSLGSDHNEVFNRLCAKERILKKIEKNTEPRKSLSTSYYAPLCDFDDSKYMPKIGQVKRIGSFNSYIAVYSALKAIDDANIEKLDENTEVIVGTSTPNINDIGQMLESFENKQKVETLSVQKLMTNAPASWISTVLGIHGSSKVVSAACAAGTESIGMAYQDILLGKTDMAICGGCDYLYDRDFFELKCFEKLKVITKNIHGYSSPFSKDRSGFMFCEGGSAMLVIEELDHALARGAEIYAEITGFESNDDGYSVLSMPEEGTNIINMLKKLIGDKKVDYYNAHGTGTMLNDKVESYAIQQVFGDKNTQPIINSTKAFVGHTISASGSIEAIVCADSIRYSKVHGNISENIIDNLNYHSETVDIEVKRAVSASFGFGGHNSAIMFEKYI